MSLSGAGRVWRTWQLCRPYRLRRIAAATATPSARMFRDVLLDFDGQRLAFGQRRMFDNERLFVSATIFPAG
jgi:hypothetical protein